MSTMEPNGTSGYHYPDSTGINMSLNDTILTTCRPYTSTCKTSNGIKRSFIQDNVLQIKEDPVNLITPEITDKRQRTASTPPSPRSITGNVSTNNSAKNIPGNSFSRVILTDWLVNPGNESFPNSEILEFSWVVYDVTSECLLEKVRHIVRPTDTDRHDISDTVLRTLKLSDSRPLEHAKSLKQVLTEFDSACSMVAPPSVCVVVGSVKLRDQLLAETCRKSLHVPKCLRGVLDLATLAAHFYPQQFSTVSQDNLLFPHLIASQLNAPLTASSEEFSSMDGCVIMSQIIKKMHLDHIYFQQQHLSTVVTGASQDSIVSNASSSVTHSLNPTMTSYQSNNSYKQSNNHSSFDYVIRMRGVPWGITDTDVIQFIEPVCRISSADVHIATNYEGKASGEVFVRVPTLEDRDKCLQELHGRYIGRRWIEVFKASQGDLNSFSMFKEAEIMERRGALRLRGLPWSTNEYEIVKFFSDGGFYLDLNNVVLGQSHDQRFNGDAWILLDTPQMAEDARRALHKKTMGRRYVELFQSTPREVDLAKRGHISTSGRSLIRTSPYPLPPQWTGHEDVFQHLPPINHPHSQHHPPINHPHSQHHPPINHPQHHHPPPPIHLHHHPPPLHHPLHPPPMGRHGGFHFPLPTSIPYHSTRPGILPDRSTDTIGLSHRSQVIRLRGLPYHANENHIVDFFHGFGMIAILPATAPIDGRPSGEAYVEFVSDEEAWRAFNLKNGALMDKRYIELFSATKQEMEFATAGMDPREIRSRCLRL